jgi:hypothetical protein
MNGKSNIDINERNQLLLTCIKRGEILYKPVSVEDDSIIKPGYLSLGI